VRWALPQWLLADRYQRHLDRLPIATRGDQTLRRGLERAQTKLPEAFPLHHDPVVVPVWQQILGEALVEFIEVHLGRRIEEAPSTADNRVRGFSMRGLLIIARQVEPVVQWFALPDGQSCIAVDFAAGRPRTDWRDVGRQEQHVGESHGLLLCGLCRSRPK
jgi:hypothetical protein